MLALSAGVGVECDSLIAEIEALGVNTVCCGQVLAGLVSFGSIQLAVAKMTQRPSIFLSFALRRVYAQKAPVAGGLLSTRTCLKSC